MCVPEAGVTGMDRWLHNKLYVWCNYLPLLLTSASGTHVLYLKIQYIPRNMHTVFFAVLCCGYTLTDFPISIRLTSLALWQSNDCPSASKATLMNMDKYFTWIHYERLHNHNKAKHNKTVCIVLGIYCIPEKRMCQVLASFVCQNRVFVLMVVPAWI